jgi:membrane-bound metal-dependent hydrolase YbcI (DUF457 family)
MPSGVGHALGGVIVGLVGERPTHSMRTYRLLGWLSVAACAPDLDFFWGRHGAETHSIGAALIVGLAVLAVTRGREVKLAAMVALAWSSHVLFDWLGSDDTPPLGVMALWPFTDSYYFARAYIFDAISRRYWLPGFVMHNAIAVIKEIAILGSITGVIWWWRRRGGEVQGGAGR